MAEPHRVQDGHLDGARKGRSADSLDHVAEYPKSRVRVLGAGAGWIHQLRLAEALHHVVERGMRRIEIAPHRRLAHQSGAVREELTKGDGFPEPIRGVKPRQVPLDRSVELNVSPLRQLHDPDRRNQLGDRSHAVDRLSRRRRTVVEPGESETGSPDDVLIVHQGNRQGGKALVGHLVSNERLQRFRHGLVVGPRRDALAVSRSTGGRDERGAADPSERAKKRPVSLLHASGGLRGRTARGARSQTRKRPRFPAPRPSQNI